jgi:hypothetical protein
VGVASPSRHVPLLCVHVRLEDVAYLTAKWTQYIPHINEFMERHQSNSSHTVDARVLIITNGNGNEKAQMKIDFPSAVLGCVGVVHGCDGDFKNPIYSAIEQETCSMADEFIGSITSSFTYLIAMKRAHRGVYPGGKLDPSDSKLKIIDSHTW